MFVLCVVLTKPPACCGLPASRLTTPPCAINVQWVVLPPDWSLTVSREQLLQYKKMVYQASQGYTAYNARLPFSDQGRKLEFHLVSRSKALEKIKLRVHEQRQKQANMLSTAQMSRRMLLRSEER